VFDGVLGDRPNQLDRLREDVVVTAEELLAVDKTPGQVTEAGVRTNVAVALRYFDSWVSGTGAAAIFNLMEDAATAEISRCQLWQWIHHATPLADGGRVTAELVQSIVDEEAAPLRGSSAHIDKAVSVLAASTLTEDLKPFFTTEAYARYLIES
jgi:malate synthase